MNQIHLLLGCAALFTSVLEVSTVPLWFDVLSDISRFNPDSHVSRGTSRKGVAASLDSVSEDPVDPAYPDPNVWGYDDPGFPDKSYQKPLLNALLAPIVAMYKKVLDYFVPVTPGY